LNNGGYASIRQTQMNYFGAQYGCGETNGLGFPEMRTLAAAYGLPYFVSSNIDQLSDDMQRVLSEHGPLVWEIHLRLDYSFEPKLSSRRLPDGRMVSPSLEDMYPFLSEDEMRTNRFSRTE